jgi:hypothetical protein
MMPKHSFSIFRVFFLLALAARGGSAQEAASPINDLLRSARDAINDLQYARADTIARQVLERSAILRRSQTVLAWQIVAAANFPEVGVRDTATARAALREAILRDLDAVIPVDIRWDGLEQLHVREKREAYGMAVRVPQAELIYGGSLGDAVISVAVSQPSSVWLYARAVDGNTQVVVDSAVNVTEATLRLRALNGLVPVLASGAYEFVARVANSATRMTLQRTMQVSITAPPLELMNVPAPFDTTRLRPEVRKTDRGRGIAAGVVIGAVAVAIGKSLRAPEPIKSRAADNRGINAGILIAFGTAAAVWYDRGVPLAENRAANALDLRNHAALLENALNENARRTAGYRARATVLLEDR